MENKTTLRTWIRNFIDGAYDAPDRRTQIDAGWFDWFCRDTSLRNKTYRLGGVVKQIRDGGKVDLDGTYVFFKNNCPLNGPLYDDFRICSIENGNVQLTVQFGCCWNDARYAVFGRTPDGEGHWEKPLFKTDSSRELVRWLNKPWEE